MKRYYLVHDDHLPTLEDTEFGHYHFIALDSHGPAGVNWNLLALLDSHVQAHADWIALPPIYDAKTTLEASAVPHETLADIGLTGAETCLEAVVRFGEINPLLGL